MSALHEALQRNPAHEAALAFLAMLLHESGRSIEALQFFAARPPEAWPETVRFNIALLHAETGNTQEARAILSGMEHGGLAAAARANLAYLDLLDADEASAAPRLDALTAPASPEVLNNVAVARLRRGDVDGAVQLLEQIIARQPQFALAHFNLALALRHYRFDDAGAARAQAAYDALAQPQISDTALAWLLEPSSHEDAAPPVPPAGEEQP
jgi:tetratricopeptide (TPR) repeat protein